MTTIQGCEGFKGYGKGSRGTPKISGVQGVKGIKGVRGVQGITGDRPSVWKDGREYKWSDTIGTYVCWVIKGGHAIPIKLEESESDKAAKLEGREKVRRSIRRSEIRTAMDALGREYVELKRLSQKTGEKKYLEAIEKVKNAYRELIRFARHGRRNKTLKRSRGKTNPVTSAEAVVERIRRARRNDLGEEKADQIDGELEKHADNLNRKVRRERQYQFLKSVFYDSDGDGKKPRRRTKDEIREKFGYKSVDIIRMSKVFERVAKERSVLRIVTEKKSKERERDRREANDVLSWLFPDRGGDNFFDKRFEKETMNLFAKYGCKNIAKEVVGFYNMIGRCFKNDDKSIVPPTIVFADIRSKIKGVKLLGDFDPKTRILRLNKKLKDNPEQLRRTFAHELGHWFECFVSKKGRENIEWLCKEQGTTYDALEKNPLLGRYQAPFRKQPNLCANDYSQVVYKSKRSPQSELVSMGMEELIADPETFILRVPKHFNLLIDNLADVYKRGVR